MLLCHLLIFLTNMKTYKLNNVEVSKQELQELIKNNPELLEKNDKNWRAEHGGKYYSLTRDAQMVISNIDNHSEVISWDYETLNYFETKEQAEAYRDYLLAVGRVSRAIWEANGDWKQDEAGQLYYINFYPSFNVLDWGVGSSLYSLSIPYIKSEEIAKQIIKDHEQDLLTIFNYKR